jgi:hypothetical protein
MEASRRELAVEIRLRSRRAAVEAAIAAAALLLANGQGRGVELPGRASDVAQPVIHQRQ